MTDELERARKRAEFHLTYAHDPDRTFGRHGIYGGTIPDARDPGRSVCAEWHEPGWPAAVDGTDEHTWVRLFFAAAVAEAVHEALEWFRVDGEVFLDPHRHDLAVKRATDAFVAELLELVDDDV